MDEKRNELKKIIMDTRTLPTLPGIINKLNTLSENEKSSVQEMARIVSSDQVLSARILRLANSPSYGFYRVSTISNAMILLGVNVVKSLALSSSIFEIMEKNGCDLVFANDAESLTDGGQIGYLLSPDGSSEKLDGKPAIAQRIAQVVLSSLESRGIE